MTQFLYAHASGTDTDEIVRDCLQQLGSVPAEFTLGFIYNTDLIGEQLPDIIQALRLSTGIQHWTGSTGMGIIASGHEYYDQPAIAVMITDFNEQDFKILPHFGNDLSAYDGELDSWCRQHPYNIGLIHGGPQSPQLIQNIAAFADTVPEAFLIGGITSSRGHHYHTADDMLLDGFAGVLFSDQVNLVSNITQGCSPIGPRHRITEAEQNIAITLDDKPALDILLDDAGLTIARDWQQSSEYIFTGLLRQNSDSGEFTVRPLVGIDEEAKIFVITDDLEQHQELVFCRCDGNSAQEDMQRMLLQLKSRINQVPKGGIYISCLGRGREQFGYQSEEARLIHSVLGDFPLVGFFANGEIHKNQIYGYTGVLTLFL